MTYELAKQLKDVGVPKNWGWTYFDNKFTDDYYLPNPTLSELIEACGDKFDGLRNDIATGGWNATSFWSSEKNGFYICERTPEEAVAKLWLELNKKSE